MKQRYLLVLCACALLLLPAISQGQCSPNSNIYDNNGSYIYPEVLPFAVADVPYSEVLTFRVPNDTVIVQNSFTINVHIDSAQLILITGIPQGYTYECNVPSCTWNGGSLGCALLSGTSSSSTIGDYPMKIYVYTWAQLGNQAPYTPYTRIDSSEYTFKVLATGLFEIEPYVQLSAYPNPVHDVLNIEVKDLKTDHNTIEVFDAMGRRVFIKEKIRSSSYQYTEQVDLSSLSRGLYTVMLRADDKVSIKKVLHD